MLLSHDTRDVTNGQLVSLELQKLSLERIYGSEQGFLLLFLLSPQLFVSTKRLPSLLLLIKQTNKQNIKNAPSPLPLDKQIFPFSHRGIT